MSTHTNTLKRAMNAIIMALMVCLIVFSPVIAQATPATPEPEPSESSDSGGDEGSDESGESGGGDKNAITSDGTANGRIKVFISLAKGAADDNKKTIDFESMSKKDFQFLGVLMTNFYTPYMTELGDYKGYNDKDEAAKIEKKARENQKKSMTAALNIEDADADILLDFMISASQETAEELTWSFGKTNMEKPADLVKSDGTTPATPYELQKMISAAFGYGSPTLSGTHAISNKGEWGNEPSGYVCKDGDKRMTGDALKECWKENADRWEDNDKRKPTKDQQTVYQGGNNYGYLVTKSGKPVFSTNLSGEYTTPSVAALAFSSQLMKADHGVGTSLLEYTGTVGDKALMAKLKKAGDVPNTAENSIYGMPLYVDAFGNIIVMGITHQYILLPGAMNPFMWTPVDEEGNDIPDAPAGSRLAPMNTIMMGLAGQDKLCTESDDDSCTLDMSNINDQRNALGGDDSWVTARILRGSKDTGINTVGESGPFGWVGSKESDEGEFIKNIFNDYAKTNTEDNGKKQKAIVDSPVAQGLGDKLQGKWYEKDDGKATVTIPYYGGTGVSMQNTKVPSLNSAVTIDDLGAFQGEVPDDGFSGLFKRIDLLKDGKLATGDEVQLKDDKFINNAGDSKYGAQFDAEDVFGDDMTAFSTLYYTYAFASLEGGEDESYKKAQGSLGFRMNPGNFPELCSGDGDDVKSCNFKLTDEQKENRDKANADQMNEDIRNWVWYILNPTEGFNYVTLLIKNKVTASTMGLHSDIVGTTNAPAIAGSTKYIGFSGYVTIPELTDLPWTDKLVSAYNDNYFYIIAIVIIIMGVYAVTGVLSLQQAIGGAVLFAILAFMPVHLLNASINLSNRVTEITYGQKFTYWALIQNQTYSESIDKAASGDDYNNYLRTQLEENKSLDITGAGNDSNNKGDDSVVVKWQAPKKMASLMFSSKATEADKALMDNPMFSNVLANDNYTKSGQAYTDSDASVYLYRSYIDLNNFSRYIYGGIDKDNVDYNTNVDTSKWPDGLKNAWDKRDNEFSSDVSSGYLNANGESKSDFSSGLRATVPLSSDIVPDTFSQADQISKGLTQKDNIGIDTRSFNFSLPAFTSADGDMLQSIKDTTSAFDQGDFDPTIEGKYDEKDYTGLAAYALMSESPFYYYSWNLYDQGMSADPGSKDGYKDLLLSGKGNPYFYNVDGNREMKDFNDMKSMFTYVIPYLNAGNDVVKRFDSTYGLSYEPGVPTDEGHWEDEAIKSDPVMKQKYWKNLQVSRLYSLYSPWVDLMHDADYAEPQTIMVQGDKVNIQDPLNPASYPDERPMVFSKSEQVDYGIDDGQLTTVEKKIQDVQTNSQERMFQLLNAYNFNDNVLNTAASMENTFEFNKEFSETHVFGENIQMYPQSYELKNFSYDAYLRLILANSTGESVSGQSANDFYTGVVENSSMVTSVVIIVLDFLSVYVIPAFKVFLVLSIGLMMVMMILMSAIRIVEGVWRNILDAIVKPLASMILVFIGMGWVVSLFMSNGNTSVTGYDGTSISLGDPVMTMLVMIAINALVVFLLWKITKAVWGNLVRFTKMIFGSMAGVAAGAGTMAAGVAKGQGFKKSRQAGVSTTAAAVGAGAAGAAAGVAAGRSAAKAEERASKNSGKVGPLTNRSSGSTRGDDGPRGKRYNKGTEKFNKQKVKTNSEEDNKKRSEIDRKASGGKGIKAVGDGAKAVGEGTKDAWGKYNDFTDTRVTNRIAKNRMNRNAALKGKSKEVYKDARHEGKSRREANREYKEDLADRKQEFNRRVDSGSKKGDAFREASGGSAMDLIKEQRENKRRRKREDKG